MPPSSSPRRAFPSAQAGTLHGHFLVLCADRPPGVCPRLLGGSIASHAIAVVLPSDQPARTHCWFYVSWNFSMPCAPPSPLIFLVIFRLTRGKGQGRPTLASQLPGVVSNVGAQPAWLLTYGLLPLQVPEAGLSSCDRGVCPALPQTRKYLLPGPYRKMFPAFCLIQVQMQKVKFCI